MQITCWGCRGSLPTPGHSTVKYGGNTTCFQIDGKDGTLIIIDAGTGLRALGNHLIKEDPRKNITMLVTHAHWDHLLGFPFFVPAYSKKYSIDIKGCFGTSYALKDIISHQFKAPYFPVKFRQLTAKITFEQASRRTFRVGGIKIESIQLNHPGGGSGYKFTEGKKSFVFLTDNELDFQHKEGLKRERYVDFCKGATLLIHDAQYTTEEYERLNRSWGHSTYDDAFDLAHDAGARRLGFCHHDQERKDDELDHLDSSYRSKLLKIPCFVVREKSTYTL
ncbi:MAG: MBL fold metallo-hydrolase [Fibrobacterota bacterium]